MTLSLVRKVLIVLEVTVIKPGGEVPGRIGNPKNINENSYSDRRPPQNGTSPLHNMSGKCSVNNPQYVMLTVTGSQCGGRYSQA